jgi:parallel beta-helix repeat protein
MKSRAVAIGLFALIASAALLTAGPLDPPSGAIAPTYKTLGEVEPRIAINAANTPGDADSTFRITKPGSYYLTESFSVLPNKSGIEIASSNVTIDLNGFVIGSTSSLPTIRLTSTGRTHISVRNGTLNLGLGDAIDLAPAGAADADMTTGGIIEDIRIASAGGIGIRAGNSVTINRCTIIKCNLGGILAGTNAHVLACTVTDNKEVGIEVSQDSHVIDCNVSGSTSYGIHAYSGTTVRGCTSSENSAAGFNLEFKGSIIDCVSRGNGSYGFLIRQGTVANCNSSNDGYGFRLDECTTTNCHATSSEDEGFIVSGGSLTASVAIFCDSQGILVGDSSSIIDCTSYGNKGSGIKLFTNATIRGNHCVKNGSSGTGGGIEVAGKNNRIDGNTCNENRVGILVSATRNIIVRNVCNTNTTNWSIVASNSVAPIVVTNKTGAAINGDTGGGSLGSSDPSANFTY